MLISVIVPVYNVKSYLNRCLDSLLAQTCRDFEAILVDDGSTDGSAEICDEYAARDPRLRVIHKPNGGLISARNVGLMAAQGEYICHVDGDDWAKPEMLQYVHDRIRQSPVRLDMVLFAGDNIYNDRVTKTLNSLEEGLYDRARLEAEVFPYLLTDTRKGFRLGNVIYAHTWDKAIRRDLMLEHYCREERIRMFTDVGFVYECLVYSNHVDISNESLYCYNKENQQSLTAGKRNYLTESFYLLVSYLQKHLGGVSPALERQVNEYPALLVIHAAGQELAHQGFFEAVRAMRKGLERSRLLELIDPGRLPRNPRILITLLRKGMTVPAMVLCAIKYRDRLRDMPRP